MAHLPTLTVRADSEPYESDFVVTIPGKPDSKPMCMRVTNMDDDEQAVLILNSIMLSSLTRTKEPLMGRYFKFVAGDVREGKKYRDVEVEEMTLDVD